MEEQVDPVQPAEQEAAKVDPDAEMVTRRKMTVSRFLPSSQPSAEPQQPQGKGQALPPSSSNRAKKKQCLDDQPSKAPSDAQSKTPPWPSNGITIREPVAKSLSAVQVDGKAAPSSQPIVPWQPTFKLGKGPLPATASAIVWDKGVGGRVA